MGPLTSNPEQRTLDQPATLDPQIPEIEQQFSRERLLPRLRLPWNAPQLFLRWVLDGLVVATALELSF